MRASKSILLSILTIPLVLAEPVAEPSNVAGGAEFDFQELLAVLPAESLHVALHKHVDDKFQDGVYEHERMAVEKVHDDDPGMATKVLAEAALHLLKRQTTNNETTATTETSTTTETTENTPTPPPPPPPPPPTTEPTTEPTTTPSDFIIPIEVPTTNNDGQASTLTTSAVAPPTVSVEQPITSTNAQGDTVVATQTVPAAVVTQDGVVTTSPVQAFVPEVADPTVAVDVTATQNGQTIVLSSVTPGAVITATDAAGGVFVTTYTPPGGTVSSLVLLTTQLPDGQLTTLTSFAVVAANTAEPSSTGGPSLQNGVDSLRSPSFAIEVIALLCAAFGAAFIL